MARQRHRRRNRGKKAGKLRARAKREAKENARLDGTAEVTQGTKTVPKAKTVHPNSMAARKLGLKTWLNP